jgi:hypothetical protein
VESTLVVVVLGIVILGAAFLVGITISAKDKRRIHDYLSERGATDIVISKMLLNGQRNTSIYDVAYTDRQGVSCRTRCTIPYGWFGGSEIYWKDSV